MSRPSIRARLLNRWLKLTEKPHLARETDVKKMRRAFRLKARLFFRAPRGARYETLELGGCPALKVTAGEACSGRVLLYLHGGAYVMGEPSTHRAMAAHLARKAGLTAYLPNYRKAPEHPFPAATEDVLAAYADLLEQVDASHIIIGGDSAGGGLALGLLHGILERGLPLPRGVFAFSPLTDMSFASPSVCENEAADVMLPAARIGEVNQMYLGPADPKDPRASPLNGAFERACPVWLTVGDTEILRDDSLRLVERLKGAGIDVTFELKRDLPHVWPMFAGLIPEAGQTLDAVAAWIKRL